MKDIKEIIGDSLSHWAGENSKSGDILLVLIVAVIFSIPIFIQLLR